jgi:16S rRNA (adenine1518-N6/adenine1519-N6)-dimethyltransferase
LTDDPRKVLREAGLAPKKRFGQNFLVAAEVTERIAAAAVPDDERGRARVVEIGAGTGALTAALAARAASVVAIERDRDLVPVLHRAFDGNDVVRIVEADAQSVDYAALGGADFVLAGNLPYQITGALLRRATELAPHLRRAVFMVQREVADRLLAAPGTKDYGALTVFVRAAFDVARAMHVAPGSFFPQPDVTSTVVVLRPRAERVEETDRFRAVVSKAFEKRRKTLRNAWRGLAPDEDIAAAAARAKVSLDARGETLAVESFAAMAAALDQLR